MRLDHAHATTEQLLAAGIEAKVMRRYSGRAMYGEQTTAVVTTSPQKLWAIGAAAIAGGATAEDARRIRADDFGKGSVFY